MLQFFLIVFSFLQVLTGDDDDLGHGHGQLGEGDDGVLLLFVQSGGAVLPASTFSNVFSILQVLTGDDDDLGPGPGQLGGGGGGGGGDGVLSCSRGTVLTSIFCIFVTFNSLQDCSGGIFKFSDNSGVL